MYYIYIHIAAYVMNSDHKITQWNTCKRNVIILLLYYLVILLFNIYYLIYIVKLPQKAGKLLQMSSNPYTD